MERQLLTTSEAAARVGVHKHTIHSWCRAGQLPGAFKLRNSNRLGWRVPADLIDALAAGVDLDAAPVQDGFLHRREA